MEATTRWYVVHTQARGEEAALRNLLRQGFMAFLPQYRKRRRHARQVDWVRAPLFPRYLFVAMDLAFSRWRAVSSTIGVKQLVCRGETPAPVPEGVVEEIRARVGEDGLVPLAAKAPFRLGEAVQVVTGVLADQIGLFQGLSDEERVVLLLEILGRPVRVKLPLTSVAPLA